MLVVGLVPDTKPERPVSLIRLNIGLEDTADLIEDVSSIHSFFQPKQSPGNQDKGFDFNIASV
ncbi:hypothetical protein D3C71_2250770 [compost metagenome]